MNFEVIVPIDGFENEKEFSFEKLDDFFSVIKGLESNEELRLMSFGALKNIPFEFPKDFIEKLQIENMNDISIFYVFVLQGATSPNTINTFAPIVINHKTNKIGQAHLNLSELGLESLHDILPKF